MNFDPSKSFIHNLLLHYGFVEEKDSEASGVFELNGYRIIRIPRTTIFKCFTPRGEDINLRDYTLRSTVRLLRTIAEA